MDASEWLKLAEAFHHHPDALALADVEEEKLSEELDCDEAETLRLICNGISDVSFLFAMPVSGIFIPLSICLAQLCLVVQLRPRYEEY